MVSGRMFNRKTVLLACALLVPWAACSLDERELSSEGLSGNGGDATPGAGGSGQSGAMIDANAGQTDGHGGIAGSAATGGHGGGAGTPIIEEGPTCSNAPPLQTELIDDLSDGNTQIPLVNQRDGFWYLYNDGTDGGVQMPPLLQSPVTMGGRGGGYAVHMSGMGFLTYADVAMSFTQPGTRYDASAYDGITFWAKGSGTIHVRATTTQTATTKNGGNCVVGCADRFAEIKQLPSEWTQYIFRWCAFVKDKDSAVTAELDPSQLMVLDFSITQKQTVDVWIDDVEFIQDRPSDAGVTKDASADN